MCAFVMDVLDVCVSCMMVCLFWLVDLTLCHDGLFSAGAGPPVVPTSGDGGVVTNATPLLPGSASAGMASMEHGYVCALQLPMTI